MLKDVDISNLIVIRVDGGICSQLTFVALGLHLKQKFGVSVRVAYDFTWFRENGKDIDGRFARNWDVPKAFPDVPVPEATAEEIALLKESHYYDGRDAESIVAPMYVGGYPDRGPSLAEQLDYLRDSFRPELCDHSRAILAKIKSGPSCAIHVRRGDLASYTQVYGFPASSHYFANAVKIVRLAQPDARFVFFSDEPEYVRRELLPVLPIGPEYVVSDGNGSDRGYEDLYLISHADFIVASVGSLGRLGAKMSRTCRCAIVLRDHGGNEDFGRYTIALDDEKPATRQTNRKGWFAWMKK